RVDLDPHIALHPETSGEHEPIASGEWLRRRVIRDAYNPLRSVWAVTERSPCGLEIAVPGGLVDRQLDPTLPGTPALRPDVEDPHVPQRLRRQDLQMRPRGGRRRSGSIAARDGDHTDACHERK